jgi:hypothetical protein
MYCLTVLQFFLQYPTNAKYLISSSSVMLKPTLMILQNSLKPHLNSADKSSDWETVQHDTESIAFTQNVQINAG